MASAGCGWRVGAVDVDEKAAEVQAGLAIRPSAPPMPVSAFPRYEKFRTSRPREEVQKQKSVNE